jgi:hypothetical protein
MMTHSAQGDLPGADQRRQRCAGPLAARAPVQAAMPRMSPSPTSLAAPITLYVFSMSNMYVEYASVQYVVSVFMHAHCTRSDSIGGGVACMRPPGVLPIRGLELSG